MKALIVDDSRALRSHLRRMLESFGFECAEACDGGEAIKVLTEQDSFDLALIDYNMPVMNGPDLLKAIKQHPSLAGMKRLMVTSMTDANFVETALSLGAHDYLMKPFGPDALVEKLQLVGLKV